MAAPRVPGTSCHAGLSTYNDWPKTLEHYTDLPGGMNKRDDLCVHDRSAGRPLVDLDTQESAIQREVPVLRELLSTGMAVRGLRR